MHPLITVRKLSEYPKRRREELCTCKVPCTRVLMMVQDSSVITLCEKASTEFGYVIHQVVGSIIKPTKYSGAIWSDLQILELKNYVKSFGNNKLPHGALRHFANEHGKTREQVKQKVTYLKSIGELPYLRDHTEDSSKN